ncbi:MAG: hypothetical protein AAF414_21845 [Pseudomonadota bacterium]
MKLRFAQVGVLMIAATLVTACQLTRGQETGAIAGAAIGTGVGLVTGATAAQVVGAGLIGGGSGFILGDLLE